MPDASVAGVRRPIAVRVVQLVAAGEQLFEQQQDHEPDEQRLQQRDPGQGVGLRLDGVGSLVREGHAGEDAIEPLTADPLQPAFVRIDVHGERPEAFAAVEPGPAGRVDAGRGRGGQRGREPAAVIRRPRTCTTVPSGGRPKSTSIASVA